MAINIAVSIGAVAVAMSSIFVIRQWIEGRVATTREKLLFLQDRENRQTVFMNLNSDYNRLTPVFPVLYSILPPPENVIVFADAIGQAAKETGNTIEFQFESSEPSPDPIFPAVDRVGFHAKVIGTGESFRQFFQRLETLHYISTVDTIDIDGPQGIYGAVTVMIRGTVFIQKKNAT